MSKNLKRILTGIQSTGIPHLGNILGAIIPAINFSKKNDVETYLFIADFHSLTQIKNSDRYNIVKSNITNKKLMEEQISSCDAVVNFAAESHVDRSINDANPFLVSNIRGAFTILDIITKQKKLITLNILS